MATNEKVCHQMHLPVQAGSTKVIKDMNRVYTKESYLDLIDRVKAKIPDCVITTDMIVGFPTETEEDFLETLDVMEKVRYDGVFSFIYSRREGTPAAKMEDCFTEAELKDRFDRLLKLDEKIRTENNLARVGKTFEVLCEGLNENGFIESRTNGGLLVHFKGEENMIGTYQNVTITEAKGYYLTGELVK